MNRFLLTIIFISLATMKVKAQQYHPQYWDNSTIGSYAEELKSDNIQTESLLLQFQLIIDADDMPETMCLQHLYRIYEIEQIASIDYVTASGEPLPFATDDSRITTLFGAELVSNEENEKKSKEAGTTVFTMKFKAPVTTIPGELFTEDVVSLRLPGQTEVNYTLSNTINVQRLKTMSGGGTRNGLLISRNGTLVAAAVENDGVCHIPDIVSYIGPRAFSFSPIQELVIPEKVQSIGEGAFIGTQMKQIFIMGTTPPIISAQDLEELSQTLIYVPKKQLKLFKKTWPTAKKKLKALPKDFL